MAKITASTTVANIIKGGVVTSEAVTTLITLGKREVKDSGEMWRQVCGLILCNSSTLLEPEEVPEQMDRFADLLEGALTPEQKQEIPIAKKTLKPAFRSWPVTKPRWQYANYIFNAISIHGIDTVFPKDKPLPQLSDVRKMQAKSGETALDTIKRSLLLAEKKFGEITPKDHAEINNALASLQVKWAETLSAATTAASASE